MPTYSVRCIFRWANRADQSLAHLYEERITIWQALDVDHALQQAELEAQQYASDGEEFIGLCQAYELAEPVSAHGVEVFSLLRESNLDPDTYLDSFYSTGMERSR